MTKTNSKENVSLCSAIGQLVEDFKEIDNAEGCETGKTNTFWSQFFSEFLRLHKQSQFSFLKIHVKIVDFELAKNLKISKAKKICESLFTF